MFALVFYFISLLSLFIFGVYSKLYFNCTSEVELADTLHLMVHIIVATFLFISSICISNSLYTSKFRFKQQLEVNSLSNSFRNMNLFFKRDSMDSGFSPIFKEKSIEFSSSKSDADYEESQTLLSASSSAIDDEVTTKSLLPPWLPSFTTACLGGLLFGSDIGCSSSVVRIFGGGTSDLGQFSAVQLGFVASSSLLGAMLASVVLIVLGDKYIGRKLELQVASVLFVIGTTLQSFAPTLALLYFGRAVFGLGIGVAMHVAPLYIAETSPDNLRGKLVSYKEAAIVGGIVLGYGAGALFGQQDSWRSVFEAVYPVEILMVIGALIVPESSRWLALRGRREEAVVALQAAQGLTRSSASAQIDSMMTLSAKSSNSVISPDDEVLETEVVVEEEKENVITKIQEIVSSPYNRRALLIGIGLVLFQQLSGQPSVLYFANRIFETAGLGYEAALGVGVFKLIMTLVSASLVENPNIGRRSLLLYGNYAICASLLSLTLLYSFAPVGALTQSAIIASILMFVGGYQVGFGPITWLILSEIFPLRVRSAALSCGTLSNFASNLLVTGLFEVERQNFGEGILFGQFFLVAVAATFFTLQFVFETQGLSLEEIERKLKTVVDG